MEGRLLAKLRAEILLVVEGCFFGVELHGALDIFDWRFGAAMARLDLFVDGGIALAPLDEVLSEAGIFEFLPELLRLHEVALKLLHILKLTIKTNHSNLQKKDEL
jgi:hypothetical protein